MIRMMHIWHGITQKWKQLKNTKIFAIKSILTFIGV